MISVDFVLNGVPHQAHVNLNTTLLHYLRAQGFTGTKEGCAEGECGACAIAVLSNFSPFDAPENPKPRYEAVNSCLYLVVQAQGREIWTVEGLASNKVDLVQPSELHPAPSGLHPAQVEMVKLGGSQCGFCTPGFVIGLFAEFERDQSGALSDDCISGNLCRCTGYRPIRDAMEELSKLRSAGLRTNFQERLKKPLPMIRNFVAEQSSQQFFRPTNLDDALALLREHEGTLSVVNGGTDLVVDINQRQVRHQKVLALDGISELLGVREDGGRLWIGAGESLAHLAEKLAAKNIAGANIGPRLLHELLPLFSSRLIRTRATLGGNLGTASPISDSPPVLLALDASFELVSMNHQGTRESRSVDAADFFLGYRKTAKRTDELIASVSIAKPYPTHSAFYKVSKRVLDDISTVAMAVAVWSDQGGIAKKVRIGVGGVAATPIRLLEIERKLENQPLTKPFWIEVAKEAENLVKPMTDHRGSALFRTQMVRSLLEKFAHYELPQTGSLSEGARA